MFVLLWEFISYDIAGTRPCSFSHFGFISPLLQNGVGDTLPTQNNLGTLVLFVRHWYPTIRLMVLSADAVLEIFFIFFWEAGRILVQALPCCYQMSLSAQPPKPDSAPPNLTISGLGLGVEGRGGTIIKHMYKISSFYCNCKQADLQIKQVRVELVPSTLRGHKLAA